MAKKVNAPEVASFTADEIDLLAGSLRQAKSAGDAMKRAQEKAQGAYTGTIMVAVSRGAASFDAAMEKLFETIRVDGALAKRFSAARTKKGDAWTVPGNLRSARSVLKDAFTYNVALLDEETDAPRSFGGIRKDVQTAKALAAEASRTDEQATRDDVVATIIELAETLSELSEVDSVQAASMLQLATDLAGWKAQFSALSGEEDTVVAQAA